MKREKVTDSLAEATAKALEQVEDDSRVVDLRKAMEAAPCTDPYYGAVLGEFSVEEFRRITGLGIDEFEAMVSEMTEGQQDAISVLSTIGWDRYSALGDELEIHQDRACPHCQARKRYRDLKSALSVSLV